MNRHFDKSTIRYYDEHADDYIRSTVGVDMQSLYKPFLKRIPEGGQLLDAGSGSGRDSKSFLDRGYSVESIDASQKMVDATTELTGQAALRTAFQEISYVDEFDGIWACASLLHLPLADLPDVFRRFAEALRTSGVFFASFKEGNGERHQEGRLFSDMNESSIGKLIAEIDDLEIVELWHTDDLRPDRSEKWLNVLLQGRTS